MSSSPNFESEFHFLGEFVDEMPLVDGMAPSKWAVAEHESTVVFEVSMMEKEIPLREFRVVLKDGSVEVIRGHFLTREPASLAGKQPSFAFKLRIASDEICVATFDSEEVADIFDGENRIDLKSA